MGKYKMKIAGGGGPGPRKRKSAKDAFDAIYDFVTEPTPKRRKLKLPSQRKAEITADTMGRDAAIQRKKVKKLQKKKKGKKK